VRLHGVSPELCTLERHQCWNGKTALARGLRTVLRCVGKRGGGFEGY